MSQTTTVQAPEGAIAVNAEQLHWLTRRGLLDPTTHDETAHTITLKKNLQLHHLVANLGALHEAKNLAHRAAKKADERLARGRVAPRIGAHGQLEKDPLDLSPHEVRAQHRLRRAKFPSTVRSPNFPPLPE